MCGRFTLTTADYEAVASAFSALFDPVDADAYRPRFNVAPTQPSPIVMADGQSGAHRLLRWATWGFVAPGDRGQDRPRIHINARAETVARSKAFRSAFMAHRCIIPADGFYEWSGAKTSRTPTRFHRPDGGLLGLAGFFAPVSAAPENAPRFRFAVLTTSANSRVASVHDRMPVILQPDDMDVWLRSPPGRADERDAWLAAIDGLLAPAAPDLIAATRASTRVNNVRNDDAACLVAELDLFS